MPERFTGLWQSTEAGSLPSCAANDFDIRIEVLGNHLEMHEGRCTYRHIRSAGGDAIEVGLSCAQEDNTWDDDQRWDIRQSGGHPQLVMNGGAPGSEFSAIYGMCPASTARGPVMEAAQPAPIIPSSGQLCYLRGNSQLKMTAKADGTAAFELNSAQGGAHVCWLEGDAAPIEDGYRYTEALDGGGTCQLDMLFGEGGRVTFRDPDWTCKNHHCGARAAFEHIEFSVADKTRC